MARIANVTLPDKKRLLIALTYIYGVGRTLSSDICKECNIDENKKVYELSEDELSSIRNFIADNLIVEDDLKRKVKEDIVALKSIRCVRGLRRFRGLPVRGQRTKTNAQTARKRRRKS